MPLAVHAEVTATGVGASAGAGGWTLADRDEGAGWVLYTRPESGSEYLRYRLIGRSEEPVQRVVEALHVKSQDDRYLGKGRQRQVLARGEDFFVSHMTIDAPFIADRDAVLRMSWRTDPATGVHHVEWDQASGAVPPVADGVVRIVSRGSWRLTPLSGGGTELIYESHSELGDSVPSWLINRMMNDQIVSELLTLQEILAQGRTDVAASPPSMD
jgi:hypothetical protein